MTCPVSAADVAYVLQGRALFSTRFPGEGHTFDAPSWDVRHLRTSQHRKVNARAYFTVYGSKSDPLPPRFANVVKAFVLLNTAAGATMVSYADVARMLWEAVLQRFGAAEAFAWSLLTEDDLLRTEQIMLAHLNRTSTYKRW